MHTAQIDVLFSQLSSFFEIKMASSTLQPAKWAEEASSTPSLGHFLG
jgi:hypothetical protein